MSASSPEANQPAIILTGEALANVSPDRLEQIAAVIGSTFDLQATVVNLGSEPGHYSPIQEESLLGERASWLAQESPGGRIQEGVLSLEHLEFGDSQGVYQFIAQDYFNTLPVDEAQSMRSLYEALLNHDQYVAYDIEPAATVCVDVDLSAFDDQALSRTLDIIADQSVSGSLEVLLFATHAEDIAPQKKDALTRDLDNIIASFSNTQGLAMRHVIQAYDRQHYNDPEVRKDFMDLIAFDALVRKFEFDHPVLILPSEVEKMSGGFIQKSIERMKDPRHGPIAVHSSVLFSYDDGENESIESVLNARQLLDLAVGQDVLKEDMAVNRIEVPAIMLALGPYATLGGFSREYIDETFVFLERATALREVMYSLVSVAKPNLRDHIPKKAKISRSTSRDRVIVPAQKYMAYFQRLVEHGPVNQEHKSLFWARPRRSGEQGEWRNAPLPEVPQVGTRNSIYTVASGGLPTLGHGHR